MALLSVIRRWHYCDHLLIREIVRRTGLSSNSIRKYLRPDTVDPQFKVPERPRGSLAQAGAHGQAVRADLVSLGYDGSYGRVAAFARARRESH